MLVSRAIRLAEHMGFGRSCSIETGRLLCALATQVQAGVVAEIGAGCGVGAAWMVTGLRSGVSFVTVEIDPTRANAVEELFADLPHARVIQGEWQQLLPHGPFNLLFADAAPAKQGRPELLLEVLRPGGMLVLDDLTPWDRQPEEWKGKPDPVRDFWLHDARVAATEVMVNPSEAVILAVRK